MQILSQGKLSKNGVICFWCATCRTVVTGVLPEKNHTHAKLELQTEYGIRQQAAIHIWNAFQVTYTGA